MKIILFTYKNELPEKKYKNKKLLLLIIILWVSLSQVFAQDFLVIKGQILESKTQKGLPFASISVKNQFKGTVSNNMGIFSFIIPPTFQRDTLRVSYIGFQDIEILIDTIRHELRLELQENSTLLNEVVLTPLDPEDYIKMAVENLPKNYPNRAFMTQAYYNNKCSVNEKVLLDEESFFNTYHSIENDTIEHQLILYNTDTVSKEITSEFYEETSFDIEGQFNTPDFILERGKTSSKEIYLDSLNFSKFNYKFNTLEIPGYRSILFSSKRPIEYLKISGEIVLDKISHAIISINYEGTINIPLKIKPLLFIAGYRITNPKIKSKRSYRNINQIWYVDFIEIDLYVEIKKRKLFKPNKQYNCMFYQTFNVNNTLIDDVKPIDSEKIFNNELPYKSQIHNEEHLQWNEINRINR